jgi:hypothetical protein
MAKLPINQLIELCQAELDQAWTGVESSSEWRSAVPVEIQDAVHRSINSSTKTYRYVLPTQTLAKLVDPALDSRSLQEGSGLAGSFDARSLCHRVVVPFDRANHSVLGGAPEPYVNNPLRIPALMPQYRAPQKNKAGFDDLCRVAEYLEVNPTESRLILYCIVDEIRSRLASVQVIYPVPNRASLEQARYIVENFLAERTGGVRLQAVSVALFRAIGIRFNLYARVDTAGINAADAATGSVADLTCYDENDQIVLAVEVKDRDLEIRHVQDKLPAVREQGVQELLFLATTGIASSDVAAIGELMEREFVTGQNVYVTSFDRFLESCLILFGEVGRRQFLIQIGDAIDEIKADLGHRETWRDLLQQL